MEETLQLQKDEMESLQAIFMDEFIVLNDDPITYELIILAEPEDSSLENGIKTRLRVEYTKNYPNEAPLITPHINYPLITKDLEKINEIIKTSTSSLIGMPMLFEISDKIKEYLQQLKGQARKEIAEEEKQKAEAKKAEKQTLYKAMKIDHENMNFTPVTNENYDAWRKKYEKEKEEVQKSKSVTLTDKKNMNLADEIEKRLTGKQFFEMKKQQAQKKATTENGEEEKEGKEEVFFYDEGAFEDIGDVEGVELQE